MKNYVQFMSGEYAFLLCTDAIAEITNIAMSDLLSRGEMREGVLFYPWAGYHLPVVNLNKRFGLDSGHAMHQLILDGYEKREDSRIMVVVSQVTGMIDADESWFQPVQPLAGEFSKLVDATLIVQDKNWLRIRSEYFY
jgi:chemotaxis signal transduction protein